MTAQPIYAWQFVFKQRLLFGDSEIYNSRVIRLEMWGSGKMIMSKFDDHSIT